MFQTLRQGATVYILYKNEPCIEFGEVLSMGIPSPQFCANYQANGQYLPQKNVIDIKVSVNGQTIDLQKLPADNVIADFGNNGMVVSTSKDAILTEVTTLRNNSQRIIDSVDKHRKNIEDCNGIIEQLSPELKQAAERDREIDGLKSDISELKEMFSRFMNQQNS